MVLFEFLGQLVTGVLVGYLALTNTLAEHITLVLEGPKAEQAETVAPLPEPKAVEIADETIPPAPSKYVYGGPIPRILLENPNYQQAAVQASKETGEKQVSAPEVPLTLPESIERSLVNIFCQYKTDSYVRTTTGTGYFISKDGVVLTNAHVAQFLLIDESDASIKDAECVLRAGNPAVPMYRAELLYISPAWIHENAKLIMAQKPTGTGERDYALLYATGPVDGETAPDSFPFIPIDTTNFKRSDEGSNVLSAGYPAEILYINGASATLTPMIASTTMKEIYTFGSNFADLFTVSGSAVGEQGSSGGPIVNMEGNAVGLIVTKGNSDTDGERSLRALTLSYIDRTIVEETGFSLRETMQGNLALRGKIFTEALAPFLSRLLVFELTE